MLVNKYLRFFCVPSCNIQLRYISILIHPSVYLSISLFIEMSNYLPHYLYSSYVFNESIVSFFLIHQLFVHLIKHFYQYISSIINQPCRWIDKQSDNQSVSKSVSVFVSQSSIRKITWFPAQSLYNCFFFHFFTWFFKCHISLHDVIKFL